MVRQLAVDCCKVELGVSEFLGPEEGRVVQEKRSDAM